MRITFEVEGKDRQELEARAVEMLEQFDPRLRPDQWVIQIEAEPRVLKGTGDVVMFGAEVTAVEKTHREV